MQEMYAIAPIRSQQIPIAKFCKALVHQFERGLRLMISAWQQDPLGQVTVKIIYIYNTLRLELIDMYVTVFNVTLEQDLINISLSWHSFFFNGGTVFETIR